MSATRLDDIRERLQALDGGRVMEEPVRPQAIYRNMSDVEPRRVESLWPGYIVRHKINLLAGYGGVGKGQLMCNLIARWSTGRPMPMLQMGETLKTLILAAEDDAHEDIRPRLDANGANVANIWILDGVKDESGNLTWVDVKRHMPIVEQIVRGEGIDLLYIDPLSSYMPGTTRRDAGDVRDAIGYIQRLIDGTGVTVIATLHLGKSNGDRRGAMRILDSVEFVNAARNVLAINDLPDEHQPDEVLEDHNLGRHKVLQVVKANSTIPGPAISFSRPLDAEVQWHGVSPVGFDESFTGADPESTSGSSEAKEFLLEELKGGMRPVAELFTSAEKVGITKKQLQSAKRAVKAKSYKETGVLNGQWFWHLPDDVARMKPVATPEDQPKPGLNLPLGLQEIRSMSSVAPKQKIEPAGSAGIGVTATEDWLRSQLCNGPVAEKDIYSRAQDLSIDLEMLPLVRIGLRVQVMQIEGVDSWVLSPERPAKRGGQ